MQRSSRIPFSLIITLCFSSLSNGMEASDHFSFVDVKQLLVEHERNDIQLHTVQDRWHRINLYRNMVVESLNNGLGDIIGDNVEHAVVEIGSGVGYRIPERLDNNVIRLQPCEDEFFCLAQKETPNIYQMNIADFSEIIASHSEKSIAHYVAVNVFDTMSTKIRNDSLEAISRTQKSGDRVSIVLDANPELTETLAAIIAEHPDMLVHPYIPAGYRTNEQLYRMSVILFPKSLNEEGDFEMNSAIFDGALMVEKKLRQQHKISDTQGQLQWAKKQYNLKVIVLEEYFAEKMKNILEENGYAARSYYHTSFCEISPRNIADFKLPILYKPVCESLETLRYWLHDDKNFLSRLKHNGLSLPTTCNDDFVDALLKSDKRLIGAEMLVIEGVKK